MVRPSARPAARSSLLSPTSSPYANALRIARMTHDEGLIARLLAMRALATDASESDVSAVVEAFEGAAMPGAAADFLRDRIARHPRDPRGRLLLARFHLRSGNSRLAAEAYADQVRLFGPEALSLADAHGHARALSRTGDLAASYTVLLRMKASAPDDAKEYWEDLAVLAWDRDDDATALAAYERVYRTTPTTPFAGIRLTTLLVDANRHEDALRVALEDLQRNGSAEAVLLLAHRRAARGEWPITRAILDAAEATPRPLHAHPEYFQLRGDCLKQLGDLTGAARAYQAALAMTPDDPVARANALWIALARGDDAYLRAHVTTWESSARSQSVLWAPMALGLARVNRYEESLRYFRLQLDADPHDARLLLDLSDVLGKLGRGSLAHEVRKRAIARLRRAAAAALRNGARTEDDVHLVEATILVVQERAGAPQADRWMSALSRRHRGTTAVDEVAADFYLSTDRPEQARQLVEVHSRAGSDAFRKHKLIIALADGDHAEIRRQLAHPALLPGDLVAKGLVALERDRDAANVISETLARDPRTADEPALREDQARIGEMRRPNVRAGATYVHVTGLDIAGPFASLSHVGLGGRLTYEATGVRMTDRSGLIVLRDARQEADAGALLRRSSPRGVTDLSAGVSYQPEGNTPVPRAALFDQRLLTARLGLTTELRGGSRIEDTSFLRLLAVRNSASVGLRYDWPRWYAAGDVEGREDQTRRYQHLAWDVIGGAEAGFKLLTRQPHLSIGVQAQASVRDNRTRLPDDVAAFIPDRIDRRQALPPSFQLLGGVVHLSRGDFSERYRPDQAPFPRYDCEAAFGALFPADTALHILCGVSVRVGRGYSSLVAFYNRGIAGVRNAENAASSLSYTLPF